ncbi:PREDICTED: protein LYK2 [Ipomoea nil]|uniref:protein LYK2 n=1 Tax=Ipomoea nil TaxID=35883 RepID=UPI0009019D7F|nr:PREDICTED: protein LYK2 [Ipomoea nil]
MICEVQLRALVLFSWGLWAIVFSLGEDNLLSCESTSPSASGYHCDQNRSQTHCTTFALLFTNSYYSSLSNLSFYLGINRFQVSEANALSADTEFLPLNYPLFIPIHCKCVGGFYGAELRKPSIKGETFYGIAKSLEGLTTCKAIREKNPNSKEPLKDNLPLLVPLRCACPTATFQTKILLSYPLIRADTLQSLALKFNTTVKSIITANNRSEVGEVGGLSSSSTLLIPIDTSKLVLGSLAKPHQPKLGYPATRIDKGSNKNPHKRKSRSRMAMIGVYIGVSVVAFAAAIAILAAFLFFHWKRKKVSSCCKDGNGDLELQQLNLSVRTASEKKVSFERDDDHHHLHQAHTPRKVSICTYTIEELDRATESFNPSNLIEGSVFHGRLNGKNLAIKQTQTQNISRIDFELFIDNIHHHPNIIRLLGTCLTQNPDSFLVFEYAKNGSLKDWLHGGLAMKNQFIASCYCFLSWDQRLRICLGVASALQFMHQIMNPPYVHRNIKSRNIFIDEEFNAKVGNFGMAKWAAGNVSVSEDEIGNPQSWNKGYLAPEKDIASPSADIFAFGVVLLEVLSGQTPITRENGKGEAKVRLCDKIKAILGSENADELREWIDSGLGENYPFEAAVTVANLARSCVEDEPSSRPHAGEIVDKLSRLVEELAQGQGEEQFPMCEESTCKPLVKAATASTM